MNQGNIGNCWFIAGVVGIMQSPKLLAKVVPRDQSFSDNYTGMFHFRFWLHGGKNYNKNNLFKRILSKNEP